jgi:pyruvate formate lyase activating enzyme
MGTCAACGKSGPLISAGLGACAECLAKGSPRAVQAVRERRRRLRARFHLPSAPPRTPRGQVCGLCANACCLAEGEEGFCGVRQGREGQVGGVAGEGRALVDWYLDPLPTNCVAAWACAAAGAGYPTYAHRRGPEYGYYNLAVFYNGCNFDCLFCQNWHHRYRRSPPRSAEELARAAEDRRVACLCYFGGDPTPQMEHALAAAEESLARRRGDILRICWETNGAMAPRLLERALELSLRSGGTIKFDLKAWSEPLHEALCGVSARATLANFRRVAEAARERPEPPLAAASTLLVPGYVGVEEVRALAEFIASLNPEVPYSLLAFHPDFALTDLPRTSRQEAEEALRAVRGAGLRRVRIGNVHLLS